MFKPNCVTIQSVAIIDVPKKIWPNLLRAMQDYKQERRKPWCDRFVSQSSELPLCMIVRQQYISKAAKQFITDLNRHLDPGISHYEGDFDFRKSTTA